ncbi:hypothetical protein AGMMS50229_06140 [Campylobacterota bacterium]|nr:hypothetical protein AGMMS50229_06140 [Campylobacterota bacterium]
MKKLFAFTAILLVLLGCDASKLNSVLKPQEQKSLAPTNAEMIAALKEALTVGSSDASTALSKTGAFSSSEIYKIFLPKEADAITKNISLVPGGKKLVDDTILRINASAERASAKAAPIFARAITEMSITDAIGILRGGNTSATDYLKSKTTANLKAAFSPDVQQALNEPIVAGVSAQKSWDTLTSSYNTAANSFAGKLAKLTPVKADLKEHVLDRSLEALFAEVGAKEQSIRANPLKAASSVVRKVFDYAKNELK